LRKPKGLLKELLLSKEILYDLPFYVLLIVTPLNDFEAEVESIWGSLN